MVVNVEIPNSPPCTVTLPSESTRSLSVPDVAKAIAPFPDVALRVCNAPFDPVSPVDEVNVNALPLLASSPPIFKYVPSEPLNISRLLSGSSVPIPTEAVDPPLIYN